MRKYLPGVFSAIAVFLHLATPVKAQQLTVNNLQGREIRTSQGTSMGIPFAKGTVPSDAIISLTDADGRAVESESYPLAYWPDGSMKWAGVSFIAAPGVESLDVNLQARSRKNSKVREEEGLARLASTSTEGVKVNTGVMECVFPARGNAIISDMRIGGKLISSEARLVATLEQNKLSQGFETKTYEAFESKVEKVTLVHNGSMKAVVKIEGKHKSLAGTREWLPFAVYCTVYKGQPTISMTHSFLFDSDGREDFIKGIGVRFSVPFREQDHNRHVRFAGDGADGSGFWCQPVRLAPGYRPSAGEMFVREYQEYLEGKRLPDQEKLSQRELSALMTSPVWGDMRLLQSNSGGFTIDKRTSAESSWVRYVEGGRSVGGALLGDCSGSLFVGIKDFWQSFPASLQVDNAGTDVGTLTAWLWAPDGPAIDMRHYDTVGHDLKINYEDYKEGWESPYGVGHRSTLELRLFDNIPSNEELWNVAAAVQKPGQFSCTPEYFYSVKAFGNYWGLPDMDNAVCADIEKQLDGMLEYYKDQVEQRSWYGFWNYGDVMHNYDFTRHDWRYDIGGWAWNNVELAPNVLLWTCFLRTGREDIWNMAEALEKHSSEVDVHHIGRFAPLGSRHNVSHWGDGCKQPRIEYAAMKRYMYYLTGGDALLGDRMTEQIGSEKAYEYARRISTWGAVDGTFLKGSLNDWAYYAGNWMVEWERTGSEYYRDRLLNSMKDIVALGRLSGRLVFDYFDPETGRFMVYLKETPSLRGTVYAPASDFAPASTLSRKKIESLVGYRLGKVRGDTFSTLFGAPEFMADMKATVDFPEFWALTDNSFQDVSGAAGGSMTGPRMAAWVAESKDDAALAALAWKNLLDNGDTDTESDGTPVVRHDETVTGRNIIKPYDEPYFLGKSAGWQRHTPSTTQWLLNALEVMEWCKKYKPE